MDALTDDEHKALKFPTLMIKTSWEECVEKWETYLNRKLTKKEFQLLNNIQSEKQSNIVMRHLHRDCKKHNLYIPLLSESNGNCLFESLVHHGIGSSIENLRRGLAVFMYMYKNKKNLLPNNQESLAELFAMFNEIEIVKCYDPTTKTKRPVKYTYDVMCQDLHNLYSWIHLLTELILLVVSYIYKTKIMIIKHNNADDKEFIHIVDAYDGTGENIDKTVYLGHLGESHYVPVDVITGEHIELYYDTARKEYRTWALEMQKRRISDYLATKYNHIKKEINCQPLADANTEPFVEVNSQKSDFVVNF